MMLPARWFLILLLLYIFCNTQVSSDIDGTNTQGGEGNTRKLLQPQLNCDGLCKQRCSLHSRPNICTRACGTCCIRCNCVPPGTSGNREACGKCYTDMTTHGNRTKCP